MAVPDYQTLMLPLLRQVEHGEKATRKCADSIADLLKLSEDDRSELIPSGRQTTLYNRVHWAATYLVQAGLLERPSRGVIRITDRGRLILKDGPDRIDNHLLLKFEEFRHFKNSAKKSGTNETQSGSDDNSDQGDKKTPDERIEIAATEMRAGLRDELLQQVLDSGWKFFEFLIIDLMVAMGYGGAGSSEHMGKSGDGGIDGIINEDPLGLDIVYLQAKCYAPGNAIGVEKIREFAGTLDERGATKGVFVTTSHFASGAKEYAERSPKRLILIDGEDLTRLLIEYGVGVRTYKTIQLKRIDSGYFESDTE